MRSPVRFTPRRAPAQETYCGLAFDDETNEVILAERAQDDDGGGFTIWSVPRSEQRTVNVIMTEVRTTVLGCSAHTDRSQLIEYAAHDEAVLATLSDAIKRNSQHALTSYAWARTPEGKITITQADRADVERTVNEATMWLDAQRAPYQSLRPHLRVETATRAIARLWLYEASDERRIAARTVALLTANGEGYALGLWSNETGLIYETEERFEIGGTIEMACAHTCESLIKLISPASLAQLSLPAVTTVVVSTTRALHQTLAEMLRAELNASEVGIEPVRFSGAISSITRNAPEDGSDENGGAGVDLNQATALALGMLLAGAEIPLLDLTSDPTNDYNELLAARTHTAHIAESRRRQIAKAALIAPFVFAAGLLCATYADLSYETSQLRRQIAAEEKLAQTLHAAANLRVAAKGHFAEYISLTDQTLECRRRQPAIAQLFNDLNQQWPAGDPSWSVSEMKTTAGGGIEFKGRTKREEAVTAFTHGLEFSNGLFSNVSNEIQIANSGSNPAGGANQNVGASFVTAPLDFTVRAVYTPLQTNAEGSK